jgi:hypothetical protein
LSTPVSLHPSSKHAVQTITAERSCSRARQHPDLFSHCCSPAAIPLFPRSPPQVAMSEAKRGNAKTGASGDKVRAKFGRAPRNRVEVLSRDRIIVLICTTLHRLPWAASNHLAATARAARSFTCSALFTCCPSRDRAQDKSAHKPRTPKMAPASQRSLPKKPSPKRRKSRANSDDEEEEEAEEERDLSCYQHTNVAEVTASLAPHVLPLWRLPCSRRLCSYLDLLPFPLPSCHADQAAAASQEAALPHLTFHHSPTSIVPRRSSSCSFSRSSSSALDLYHSPTSIVPRRSSSCSGSRSSFSASCTS